AAEPPVPWQRKIRRLGQTNMTEHDPAVLDVEQWADYWASLKIDAVMVSVTGILAFYQTKVPYHRKGKFLGNRDFFRSEVEQWADYWASLKIDAVMVSVTGILAFYQTKVPYHRKGKFLGNRDFFGEC